MLEQGKKNLYVSGYLDKKNFREIYQEAMQQYETQWHVGGWHGPVVSSNIPKSQAQLRKVPMMEFPVAPLNLLQNPGPPHQTIQIPITKLQGNRPKYLQVQTLHIY